MTRRPDYRPVRQPAGANRRRKEKPDIKDTGADVEPLTKEQAREIKRRLRDLQDPTRYMLVSNLGPRFKLYYEISDDVYVMNEPARATLFKSLDAALAVRSTLGPGIKLIRCNTRLREGKRMPMGRRGGRKELGRRARRKPR